MYEVELFHHFFFFLSGIFKSSCRTDIVDQDQTIKTYSLMLDSHHPLTLGYIFFKNVTFKWQNSGFNFESFIWPFFFFSRLTLYQTVHGFYVSAVQVFCKHCGKRRKCSQFLLFPHCFLPIRRFFCHFHQI